METTFGLFVLFLVLQVADFLSTYWILDAGGKELNPLVRKVLGTFGPFVGLLAVKTIAIGLGLFLFLSDEWVYLVALDVIYVAVVIHNLKQL